MMNILSRLSLAINIFLIVVGVKLLLYWGVTRDPRAMVFFIHLVGLTYFFWVAIFMVMPTVMLFLYICSLWFESRMVSHLTYDELNTNSEYELEFKLVGKFLFINGKQVLIAPEGTAHPRLTT